MANSLGKIIADELLKEIDNGIEKIVVIYPGRFQPFGKHHAKTFKYIQNKFKTKDAYIATSDKVEIPKSPFTFEEKKKIISKYGIKSVIKVKNPYISQEILSKYNPHKTSVIFVVGKKDADRLSGSRFYEEWKGKAEIGFDKGAYYYIAPHVSLKVSGYGEMSGTSIRKSLGNKNLPESEKKKIFKAIFGHTDKSIYDLVVGRLESLNGIMNEFLEKSNVIKLLKEISSTGGGIATATDDGPRFMYGNQSSYRSKSQNKAMSLGFDIANYLSGETEFEVHDTDYPDGPAEAVSYFPVGESGLWGSGTNYTKDLKGAPAFQAWKAHIIPIAEKLGYEIVNFLQAKDSIQSSAYEPIKKNKEPLTEGLLDHARRELQLAGLFDKDADYGGLIAYAVMEMIETFSKQGHSGFSAQWSMDLFKKLANWENLTEITDNPEDWENVSEMSGKPLWQCKRNPALFSEDGGKTWYNVNEKTLKEGIELARKLLSEVNSNHKIDTRILLQCGGLAGHMNHPFDDNDMTFGDFKNLIDLGLQGKLDLESNVSEKLDGQNLMVTWKDGKLKAARNKSERANPIDIKGVETKFSGRGDIQKAFVFAMEDLEKAVSKLSDKQKNKIFLDGRAFMNLEIIYPSTKNIIDYDGAYIIFHGAVEYDENGNVLGNIKDSARMLAGMIKQVNQDVQKNFSIGKPVVLKVNPHQDYSKKKSYFLKKLDTLQKKFNLKDSDNIGLYHQKWWEDFVSKKAKNLKYSIPNNVLMGLVKRWAFFDKSYSIGNMRKEIKNESFLNWAIDFDKNDHGNQFKNNMFPFEVLTLELGAEILKNVEGFLSANPDKTIQDVRTQVASAIKQIRKGNDVKNMKILRRELERINVMGGFDNIVPSEGIVIKYNNKIYKFTGTYSSVNKIAGLLKF